ncbi:MAG: homocysteine biosynthesis protein [Candidatus Hadarchaeota archaeon]
MTTQVSKSVAEINEKIRRGDAVVVTAEEMVEIVRSKGDVGAAKEVDVVTTGTFGAMCSSGAFLNFGHSDPPIKLGGGEAYLNDVPAYAGLAAVDTYLGVAAMSRTRGFEYGGGHVIEDLIRGKEIELRGSAYGTDCYPRRDINITFNIGDLNQAVLCNPRNSYQRYVAATNSKRETIYTYMGTLLPNHGNVTFSGAGCLSPVHKDPNYETIGVGTRIFLGGAQGLIFWEGTQHAPTKAMGTIMTVGDLKEMSPRYIRGATVEKYGTTLYVGLGIPIPVINERVAKTAGAGDDEIKINLLDYGVPRRDRPVLREVTYAELKSGSIDVNGRKVQVSPLSSLKGAREIAAELKKWINDGRFVLSQPARLLSTTQVFRPMKQAAAAPSAKDLMTRDVVTARPADTIFSAAKTMTERKFDHLPIVDDAGRLVGIVTSWDITAAVGKGKEKLAEIMTSKLITALEDEPVDSVARKLDKHWISGMPVVGQKGELKGIITSSDLSRLLEKGEK